MNEMAMVEYLLKEYAKYDLWSDDWPYDGDKTWYLAKMDMAKDIIQDRFGMTFRETGTEYIAENSVCSVRVKKE